MIQTAAPAKINLYLHVTGRREDGYHLLDSLVFFASIGDVLRLEEAEAFSFSLDGPMAPALAGEDSEKNLVVRGARALAAALGKPLNVALTLTKNLPVASGIGGGSTDGAAALRLLAAHWNVAPDDALLFQIAKSLGQDVPCCIEAKTCYFRGIGDVTDPGPDLPHVDMVLANPRKALPTPAVFKAREGAFDQPSPLPRSPQDVSELVLWLAERRNALSEAAIRLCPEVGEVLRALATTESCLLSRMSGSGATCFGLFPDRSSARAAAAKLYQMHPDWWVVAAHGPFSGFGEEKAENSLDACGF